MVPYKMSNFLFRLFVWATMDSTLNRSNVFGSIQKNDQTLPLLKLEIKNYLNTKIQTELRNFRI